MNPIPSAPKAILRTAAPFHHHLLLEDHNGEEVTVTHISKDCALFDFHCEIMLPNGEHYTLGSSFLDPVDKSAVPATHQEAVTSNAWLFCKYRDEAHPAPEWERE